jgi:hypothetical protein
MAADVTSIVGIEFLNHVRRFVFLTLTSTRLASLRAGLGMISLKNVSIFTTGEFRNGSHARSLMQLRLTGYIVFGATFRVRLILQLRVPEPKNHRKHISIPGRRPHSARPGSG